jgi:deoxycytidylate deaminase
LDATDRNSNKCPVCARDVIAVGKKYCLYHSQAYDSLRKQYKAWVNAYGGISMEAYMKKLLDLDQTGDWVKDVIRIELKGPNKA